jgi:hypothetical protein
MKKIILLSVTIFTLLINSFAGSLKVFDVAGAEIVLIHNLTSDNKFTEYFTIQYLENSFPFLHSDMQTTFVSYEKGKLTINVDNTNYTFDVKANSNSESTFKCNGVGRHTNQYTLNNIDYGSQLDLVGMVKLTNGGTVTKCTDGGPGSSQCGVGSTIGTIGSDCEVTCGSGTYACCNNSSIICGCVSALTGGYVPPIGPIISY